MPDIGYVNPVDDKELKALRGTYETIAKRLEADKAAHGRGLKRLVNNWLILLTKRFNPRPCAIGIIKKSVNNMQLLLIKITT